MEIRCRAFLTCKRGVANEQCRAGLVVLRIADGSAQEILLVESGECRLAEFGFIEWRLRRVEAKGVLIAELVGVGKACVLIGTQHGHQVHGGVFDHIDLAGQQRVRSGNAIGDGEPFHTIHIHGFATREPARLLGTSLVGGILDVDHLVPGPPLVLLEDEWSRARIIGDLLVRRCLGDTLWHHERNIRARLGQASKH